jgi:predicted nucleotide-binding protein
MKKSSQTESQAEQLGSQAVRHRLSGSKERSIMSKPSLFIGSSSEGLNFARAVRSSLDKDSEITMWNEDFFGQGSTFIETLINALSRFDFAILVLTPDDWVSSRKVAIFGPRDNVVFELGLFMGRLGRERTFLVHQGDAKLKIPTDLSRVTTATYGWPRQDGSHQAAVGAACDSIRKSIRALGVSETKTYKQISDIQSRQNATESSIRTLQLLVKGLVTEFESDKLRGLAAKGPFMVQYHDRMLDELRRLRALGYVEAQPGYGIGSIRGASQGETFDLKKYVRILAEGLEYLEMRGDLLRTSEKPT